MNARKPNFFIVGAAKCGTTSMYQYLRQHPDVFMPPTKWINYFNTDLRSSSNCPDRDAYLELFAEAGAETRLGEASESYLYSRSAAAAIERECPGSDIIIMLRDPVEMLHSLHSQLLASSVEDIEDFGEALEAEADRKRGERLPPPRHHPLEWLFYRDVAKLAGQVQRYLDIFGRERVHIVLFDDFARDALGVYRETLEFLEVDGSFRPEIKVHNRNTIARSRVFDRMIRRPPAPLRRLARALVPTPDLRRQVERRLARLNRKEAARRPMSAELAARLRHELHPEIERLADVIDRDLSRWTRNSARVLGETQ